MEKKGLIVVLSGPSGAGKGTIYKEVLNKLPELALSISVTTRAPRPGEVEGVNYYYVTEQKYQQMIANGEFLETAEVYKNFYGTPKAPVFEKLKAGKDVLFELDTLGAAQMRKSYPDCVTIFIMTPTLKCLEERLRARNTETENLITRRLSNAKREIAEYKNYDYFIINDVAEKAAARVVDIIRSEKLKTFRNMHTIDKLLNE